MAASSDAFAYGYELVVIQAPVKSKDAFSYGYESVRIQSPALSRDGFAYGYENVANNANPTQLKVWDGVAWVRKPYYVWNGSAWVQVT